MTLAGSPLTGVATAVPGVLSELRRESAAVRPLVLSGAPSLTAELRSALSEGGDPDLVGSVGILDLDRPEVRDGAAVVYLVRQAATPGDEHALRRADRSGIPLLCVIVGGSERDVPILPYVLATDVIRTNELDRPAIDAIARRLAVRAPEHAWAIAGRLPALRRGVMEQLVSRAARRNAILSASSFAPGPDFPALTLGQLRLALRLMAARGMKTEGPALVAGLAGALAAGLAGRTLARRLRHRLPIPTPLIQAAVAYAGTRAVAEAVQRLPEQRATPGAAPAGKAGGSAPSTTL